jgi:acyl transferase domain-containing protein/acyl carrier protein
MHIADREPIAIVGLGCRFPGGVNDAAAFWELLLNKRSGIVETPPDRWCNQRFYHPEGPIPGKATTRWGGFIENYDQFDAAFFGLSTREADRMDPQHRWLLEVAWETIEDAGIPASSLRGSDTGVFIGVSTSDYGTIQLQRANWNEIDVHTNSGISLSIASNRVSYFLDFHGPSMSIDTACSSALVAVDLACRSLWLGECRAALAGGVNSIIVPELFFGFSRAQMLSPTGQCHTFDQRADGYVRSEGAGMVLLKPLANARADKDNIYAVIRATAVNQDGNTSAMTIPSGEAQESMLRWALDQGEIAPKQVVYMEAHGTGTPMGDPIETVALGRVLSEGRSAGEVCYIGSVKTNIGHLEPASGIAGLIKAALVLHHQKIPANLNFATPNPDIPFDRYRLRVPTRTMPLPVNGDAPPVAGVNSFGFGGTNAHVLLEAAPKKAETAERIAISAQRPHVLTLSARHPDSLTANASAFLAVLEDASIALPDLCYNAGARKEHHRHRLAIVGESRNALRHGLERFIAGDRQPPGVLTGRSPNDPCRPVFVFTGQGAQWWGMGRMLLAREPVFQSALEEIDRLFHDISGQSLLAEMQRSEAKSQIDRTDVAQPAIFALQAGLIALWGSWGIHPQKVVGHSVGEVAAAYCAGIYSLADAVKVIFHRSRLQQTVGGRGAMAAVGIPPDEANATLTGLEGRVSLAAVNSPSMVTLSGDSDALAPVLRDLKALGQYVKPLPIDFAFHSHRMDPVREPLLEALDDIRPHRGNLPFVSTVTATVVSGELLDAGYWWRNVRQPVLFGPAIQTIADTSPTVMLEIGPHPALQSAMAECLPAKGGGHGLFHSLRRDSDESLELLTNLARMHLYGLAVDWRGLTGSCRRFVALPGYCWRHKTHWMESARSRRNRTDPLAHPFLTVSDDGPQPSWCFLLSATEFDYLRDHRISNQIVFPAAGYAEMGLALSHQLFPREPHVVENLTMNQALFLPENEAQRLRISFEPGGNRFFVHSTTDSIEWHLHAQGRLVGMEPETPEPIDIDNLRSKMAEEIESVDYYDDYATAGFQFGPCFQQVARVWRGEGQSIVRIDVPTGLQEQAASYRIHPAVLDACLHGAQASHTRVPGRSKWEEFYLPTEFKRICLYQNRIPDRLWAHTRTRLDDDVAIVCDIIVYDAQGKAVAAIDGFRAEYVDRIAPPGIDPLVNNVYRLGWEEAEAATPVDGPSPSEGRNRRPVVVFSDEGQTGQEVIDLLSGRGHAIIQVRHGVHFNRVRENAYTIRADSSEDLRRLTADITDNAINPAAIVHCWSLDQPPSDTLNAEILAAAQQLGIQHLWRVAQEMATSFRAPPQRVIVVTRSTQAVVAGDDVSGLAGATMAGFVRVANSEYADTIWVQVDLDGSCRKDDAEHVTGELLSRDLELDVAFRGGKRFVPRLHPESLNRLPTRTRSVSLSARSRESFRLACSNSGSLDDLRLVESTLGNPAPNQVQVRVRAAGINFRDVMKALGMYPGNAPDRHLLGDDFAGTILQCGHGVNGLAPGDGVCGVVPGAFGSVVNVDSRAVFKMPSEMTFAEAATLPTVFLTAHHTLVRLARIRPEEAVLIHAAAGGVGQAAIQVARDRGAHIFATAGSDKKRQFLQTQGIANVMDSRRLHFADQILEATDGRGVDVVLNSLSGDAIDKSLSVLAPFGRYLEIGKVDVYQNRRLGMEALKNNIALFVVDLAQVLANRSEFGLQLFAQVADRIARGNYEPLPKNVFSIGHARDAFRLLARGRHMGKVVLAFDDGRVAVAPEPQPPQLFTSDGTYLITGGAAGVGLELALWMAKKGARHLVLLSRSGPKTDRDRHHIDGMRQKGVSVTDARCDVTDLPRLRQMVAQIEEGMVPLKGIFHCAAVLEDDMIANLPADRIMNVLGPKILGAWNLYTATTARHLDFFICFSSVSALTGAGRQANYAAANGFLDAFVHYLQHRGIPAMAINWGVLKGAGLVELDDKIGQYLEKVGFGLIQLKEVQQVLAKLLAIDAPQLVISRMNWAKLDGFSDFMARSPLFSVVRKSVAAKSGANAIRERLKAMPPAGRTAELGDFLVEQFAAVFGSEASQIDRQTPMNQLGLDSLMAVELINRVENAVQCNIPVTRLLSGPTIEELAAIILKSLQLEVARQSEGVLISAEAPPPPDTTIDPPVDGRGIDAGSVGAVQADIHSLSDPTGADAVAINYWHDAHSLLTGLSRVELIQGVARRRPMVTEIYHLTEGRIAIIRLPFFEDELLAIPAGLKDALLEARQAALALSARTIALTGVLSTLTRHGVTFGEWVGGNVQTPAITTGDATRAATVVFAIEGLCATAGRDMGNETVAFIGISPFSQAVLQLMLERLAHPQSLVFCDPFRRRTFLAEFARTLNENGFSGEIDIVSSENGMPSAVYSAGFIVGATTWPMALDISRLGPGTLLVDYSFPPLFDPSLAMQRLEARNDLLFTSGAHLRLGQAVRHELLLPDALQNRLTASGRPPFEIEGCILAALLTRRAGGIEPTLGPVTLDAARQHYDYLRQQAVVPARLQMGAFVIAEEQILRFVANDGQRLQKNLN